MKVAGIIGGIAPESTIEYYRLIVAAYRERLGDGSYPALLINSIDMQKMLGLIAAEASSALTEYLLREIDKLARAGAEFGLLASNTPHVVFAELRQRAPLPLLSLVEAVCFATQALGLKRAGLIGTRFTMQGNYYPAVFGRAVDALGRIPLRLVSQAASRRNVTFVLRNADVPEAMNRLHGAFFSRESADREKPLFA